MGVVDVAISVVKVGLVACALIAAVFVIGLWFDSVYDDVFGTSPFDDEDDDVYGEDRDE